MSTAFWHDRRFAHERVVAAYACTYLAALAVLPLMGSWFALVTNVLYFGIGIATAWTQLEVARRLRDDRASRRAWTLMALSSAMLLVSGSVWTVALAVLSEPLPVLLELFTDIGYVPLALPAFMAFPSREGFSLRDPRVRLDGALFLLGSAGLSWHFALRPLLSDPSARFVTDFIPIVSDWGLALVATIAYLRAASQRDRDAIGFLLAGHLLYILTEYFWSISRGQYVPGHWVDAIWFAAWVLRWVGSRRALHATASRDARVTTDAGLGPSIFVVAAYLALVTALLVEPAGGVVDIALAAAGMTALLVMRQRAALAENLGLARETAALASRFKALAAAATDFVIVVDAEQRVTYVSPSVERFTLVRSPTSMPLASLLHPDDEVGVASWLVAQSGAEAGRGHRCRLKVAPDGYREVEFRAQDRRDDPLIGGYVLNGRDISAELQLEAQLGHARKLGTLSDMAGRIAHAFNNALAVLQGHAELLMTQLPPDAPAREDVRALRAAAERGAGITRQLLGFSGRHVIRPELLDPGDVAAALLPSMRRLLPSKTSIALERSARGAVLLDRSQFEQVMLNLVANARDGMPDGGTIRVVVRNRHASQRPAGGGDALEVLVSDEGTGIPEELRARVFEPFFTTKASGQGTGLGLAMVASIVKRAGGQIEVQSEVGKGTTIIITLPCADSTPVPQAPSPAAPPMVKGAGVVLLVDDDPLVRRASARVLERMGFSVLETGNGREALDVAGQPEQPIDVLLTDLMMPGMSGREVIARFREVRPGVPVVCMTGFAAEREDAGALALAVHAIVAKPFTSETLAKTLTSAIAGRAAARAG